MEKCQEKLDIVDENDNIIGQDTRENVHNNGLLHREIHLIVYNDKEILFQKRSENVDYYQGLWDISVGGHVALGDSYQNSAQRELKEETSIEADIRDIEFIKKVKTKTQNNNKINYKFKCIFSYKIKPTDILKIEDGKATELKFYSLGALLNLKNKKEFIPVIISDEYLEIYKQLLNK